MRNGSFALDVNYNGRCVTREGDFITTRRKCWLIKFYKLMIARAEETKACHDGWVQFAIDVLGAFALEVIEGQFSILKIN